jgi:hypothetical protein
MVGMDAIAHPRPAHMVGVADTASNSTSLVSAGTQTHV